MKEDEEDTPKFKDSEYRLKNNNFVASPDFHGASLDPQVHKNLTSPKQNEGEKSDDNNKIKPFQINLDEPDRIAQSARESSRRRSSRIKVEDNIDKMIEQEEDRLLLARIDCVELYREMLMEKQRLKFHKKNFGLTHLDKDLTELEMIRLSNEYFVAMNMKYVFFEHKVSELKDQYRHDHRKAKELIDAVRNESDNDFILELCQSARDTLKKEKNRVNEAAFQKYIKSEEFDLKFLDIVF